MKRVDLNGIGMTSQRTRERLIQRLVEGSWNEEEYLIVPPGQRIRAVYDWEEILRVGE